MPKLTTANDYNDLPIGNYIISGNAAYDLQINAPDKRGAHRLIVFKR